MSAGSLDLGNKSPPLIDTLRQAMAAHAAGQLGQAQFYCRLVLARDKKQFDALHLLGLIEFQLGRLDEAHRLVRQAVKINPQSVPARSNFGLILQHLDRHQEALINLDKALSIDPDYLLALNNRGHVLWRMKRAEEALESLDRALAIKPDYSDALCNRGNALVDLLRLEEALVSYDRALEINPQDGPTWNNRGNVLWALNLREEALQSYEKAAALDPDDLATLKDRGTALLSSGHSEAALECFDRALRIKPNDRFCVFKRGGALIALSRYEEALDCIDQAFTTAPDDVDALDDRGNALAALQRHDEALQTFDKALAISPESANTHWNRALALLRVGDFEQGWKEYEWRWKLDAPWVIPRNLPQELLWLGESPIEGKTILLTAEQGFGETIQFVRFVPLVAARGAKVILEVQPELKLLLSSIKGAEHVIGKGEALPPFDLHCPLLSLPFAFGTEVQTIPADTPYLSASEERVALWKDRLPKSPLPRIGVVWGGNPNFVRDRARSIGLPPFAPLFSTPGFQFISIQKDLRAGDDEILRNHPQVIHIGADLADFSDTAAVMSQLDLVISSDTSPVHLAGALGRQVWVLLDHVNDWRWMLDRGDSPWYPTATLFRQPKIGDWESLVSRVAAELSTQKFS